VAARLDAKAAAAACVKVAAVLGDAITKATDPWALEALAKGLSAVAGGLGPKDAAAACANAAEALTQAIARSTEPLELTELANGLSAVAAHLDPTKAAADCDKAATALLHAISMPTKPHLLVLLAESLSSVSARLPPTTAVKDLTEAIGTTSDPPALAALAKGLLGVAGRLDAEARAAACNKAAAILNQVWSTGPYALEAVAKSRSAVRGSPLDSLSTPQLVELLKGPLCIGEARRIVLASLGDKYKRSFADEWDFLRFNDKEKLDLDITTPPKRPPTGAASP
jgi:hypothetical protein